MRAVGIKDRSAARFPAVGDKVMVKIVQLLNFTYFQLLGKKDNVPSSGVVALFEKSVFVRCHAYSSEVELGAKAFCAAIYANVMAEPMVAPAPG